MLFLPMRLRAKTKQIKHALLDLDIRQADLSRETGIDMATLNQIINAKKYPKPCVGERIAQKLKHNLEYFFDPVAA